VTRSVHRRRALRPSAVQFRPPVAVQRRRPSHYRSLRPPCTPPSPTPHSPVHSTAIRTRRITAPHAARRSLPLQQRPCLTSTATLVAQHHLSQAYKSNKVSALFSFILVQMFLVIMDINPSESEVL